MKSIGCKWRFGCLDYTEDPQPGYYLIQMRKSKQIYHLFLDENLVKWLDDAIVIMMNEPFKDEIYQYFGPIDLPEESGAEKLDRAMKAVDNPRPFQEERLEDARVDDFIGRLEALTPLYKRFVEKIDIVWEFVKDECVLLDHERIESSRLYRCYEDWCYNNGLRSVSSSVFCKKLLGCFPSSIDFRREKYTGGYFMGITIREKENDLK